MSLFRLGNFPLHSGGRSSWKIDCDALTNEDWETLASMISNLVRFGEVIGIPRGGERLAQALKKYGAPLARSFYTGIEKNYPTLIVDDVLTTGHSMELMRKEVGENSIGVVVFARGKCPAWITPLCQANILLG